jgi:hypothetical protein
VGIGTSNAAFVVSNVAFGFRYVAFPFPAQHESDPTLDLPFAAREPHIQRSIRRFQRRIWLLRRGIPVSCAAWVESQQPSDK